MKFISLFAGIGGLDLGLERAGMECVAQVEINEFALKVLQKHWANVPKFKDVRDVGKHNLPPADLICGGFPCQDVSLAGKQKGLEGKRSTLWSEFHRIVCEVRPRWVIIENVPGLFTSNSGRFFTKILRDLSTSGYHAEWRTLSAFGVGANHIRERVFIVSYSESVKSRLTHQQQGRENLGAGSGKVSWNTGLQREVSKSEWWSVEPAVGRVAHGIPDRLDRLTALGNAVVPQVAEFVGVQVMKAEARLTPLALDGATAPIASGDLPADVLVGEGTLPEPPRQ